METSALPMTSRVILSTSHHLDEQVGALVGDRVLAREDDGGRVHLLDDRRAVQAVAGEEALAPVDRRGDVPGELLEVDGPLAGPGPRPIRKVAPRPRRERPP